MLGNDSIYLKSGEVYYAELFVIIVCFASFRGCGSNVNFYLLIVLYIQRCF